MEKVFSTELNLASSKLTLVGKNKDFKGPKTHRSILAAIHKETKSNYRNISMHTIEKIILGFVNRNGIAGYFPSCRILRLKNIGIFEPVHDRRLEAIKRKVMIGKRRKKYRREYQREYRKINGS